MLGYEPIRRTAQDKSRFSEAQIVAILKELKAGKKVGLHLPQTPHQRSDALQLTRQIRRPEVSVLIKLRQLEDEKRRLKEIVADQALSIEALKVVAEGNL